MAVHDLWAAILLFKNRDFDDLYWKLECATQTLYGLYIIRRNFELIDSFNLWKIDKINYFSI